MNRLTRILKSPLRAWRSIGHGVHSPFAFDFITKTLSEPTPYYVYPSLRHADEATFPDMRLLFKVLCRLQPQSFGVIGDINDSVCIAAMAARSTLKPEKWISGTKYDVLLVNDVTDFAGKPSEIEAPTVIVTNLGNCNQLDFLTRLLDGREHGMDFSNGLTSVFCNFNHLPRQSFHINFR